MMMMMMTMMMMMMMMMSNHDLDSGSIDISMYLLLKYYHDPRVLQVAASITVRCASNMELLRLFLGSW